jgi:polyisoprenoid-binding protein YceI
MIVAGTTVSAASFTAQMATVTSDEGRRDSQFRNRIMDVQEFPTATFVMSKPLSLDPVPAATVVETYRVSGKLTMHGVTKDITIDLSAKRVGGTISVNGEIPITLADYSISNPSAGPARVGDDGTLEVLLVFTKRG